MIRFIVSGFQSVLRSVVSNSRRHARSLMAAAGSGSDADVQEDLHDDGDGTDDLRRLSDSDKPNSDTEHQNGNSETVSRSNTSDDDLPSLKWQLSACAGSRVSLLEREKDCLVSGMLSAKEQPSRQFHFSPWNNSEKAYNTRQGVVSEEKGQQNGLHVTLPYLTFGVGRLLHLPNAEAVSVRHNAQPRCNQKVTVIGCEAENRL